VPSGAPIAEKALETWFVVGLGWFDSRERVFVKRARLCVVLRARIRTSLINPDGDASAPTQYGFTYVLLF
jgi:hypothetical protein